VLNRLVALQKRALRIITGSSYLSSTSRLFTHLKLLKLTDIYQFSIVQFMFKFIYHLLPKSCLHLCSISTDCNYETRHRSLFRISTFCTNIAYISVILVSLVPKSGTQSHTNYKLRTTLGFSSVNYHYILLTSTLIDGSVSIFV